jgi:hypothetical protein
MRRSHSWPVIATFVVIILEIVGAILLSTLIGGAPGSDATAYATVLFVLATGAVGTLIGLRRPGNSIGRLLRVAAFGFATGSLLVTYVEIAVYEPGSLAPSPSAQTQAPASTPRPHKVVTSTALRVNASTMGSPKTWTLTPLTASSPRPITS